MSIDWLAKLKQYAPDIAAAVVTGGATLPALALKAVADAVGSPIDTVEQLGIAVTGATPEDMVRVTQANNAFKIRMRELDNELVATELGDVQNARSEHKHSRMPAVICIALTLMVAGGAALLFTQNIPDGNVEITYLLFGTLLAKWGDSIAYWVGTTRSSANKDNHLTKRRP